MDSLFKATVQPDDKNSERHVLLVGRFEFTAIFSRIFENLDIFNRIFQLDQPALNLFARDFYIAADNDERLAYMTLIRWVTDGFD